jgi:hypothetical protein
MTRQLHAAVPTSETPGCRLQRQNIQMRDLCHPLNSCGAQVSEMAQSAQTDRGNDVETNSDKEQQIDRSTRNRLASTFASGPAF